MIKELNFLNYRNITNTKVLLDSKTIVLLGNNGQGKSNFIEAIYMLCCGSTFRHCNDKEIIKFGENFFSLSGKFIKNDLIENISIDYNNGKKNIVVNEKHLKDRKNLVELNPAVLFSHSDLEFADGEPERKRFFFDQTASLAHPSYIDDYREYKKILKNRNFALKEKNIKLLNVLDEQLIEHGIRLTLKRDTIIREFSSVFSIRYERVSKIGKQVSIEYIPSWKNIDDKEKTHEAFRKMREEELDKGATLSGPHRDRFKFVSDGKNFSTTASTGQLRLLALLLRIAQAEYCMYITGNKPILLFDDVLLELDLEKRKLFMENIQEYEQIFFTFLPDEAYRAYIESDTLIYWVQNGKFESKNSS